MPSLLALDTSSEASSVALWHQGQLLEETRLAPRQHAQLILPQIQALLAEAQLSMSDLDGLVFGRGPGSFTGLRIAAATTQGLALALDLPVLPISTLAAQAWQAHQDCYATRLISCLDARMDEIYWAVYQVQQGQLISLTEEQLSAPEALLVEPKMGEDWLVVGSGGIFEARFPALTRQAIQQVKSDVLPSAAAMLPLALQDWAAQRWCSAAEIEPTYLRNQVTHQSATQQPVPLQQG